MEGYSSKPTSLKTVAIILISVCVGLIGGVGAAKTIFNPSATRPGDNFYDAQSASVDGKITNINGKTITVRNRGNISRQIRLSDNLAIVKPGPAGVLTQLVSSNPKDIELNTEVGISLQMTDGQFEASTINYAPTAQTPREPQSSIATKSNSLIPTQATSLTNSPLGVNPK